jgi:hypothetical protein
MRAVWCTAVGCCRACCSRVANGKPWTSFIHATVTAELTAIVILDPMHLACGCTLYLPLNDCCALPNNEQWWWCQGVLEMTMTHHQLFRHHQSESLLQLYLL